MWQQNSTNSKKGGDSYQNSSSIENGADSYRIVGGTPAAVNRYPYLVALIEVHGPTEMYQLCAGVLISPDVVLTAGHCASKVNTVQIGRYDLSNWAESYETFDIVSSVVHPQFQKATYFYDYALLKISGKSTYTYVDLNDNTDIPATGSFPHVIGWGATESGGMSSSIPNEVAIQCMTNDECRVEYSNEQVTDTMLCASSPGRDACQGDSGGPLIVKGGNSVDDVLVGLVSWGYGCADPLHPGVYSRVSAVIEWIEATTCNLSPDSCVRLTQTSPNSTSLSQSSPFNNDTANDTTVALAIRSPSVASPSQRVTQGNSWLYNRFTESQGEPLVMSAFVLGCFLVCFILAFTISEGLTYVGKRARKAEQVIENTHTIEVTVPSSP